jgi:hypothetical protein
VLLLKFESPEYVAVTVGVPSGKLALTHVATPLTSVDTAHPRLPTLVVHVIVPVGIPLPGLAAPTAAVNVTLCPYPDGFRLDTTPTVAPALFTTWLTDWLLLMKLLSPAYVAVTVFGFITGSPLVVQLATPELFSTDTAHPVLPLHVTAPVGTQLPPFPHPLPLLVSVTVAVNVTLCPYTDPLGWLETAAVALVAFATT